MYIDIDNILNVVGIVLQIFAVLGIFSGVIVGVLAVRGKRKGDIPKDTNILMVMLTGTIKFPQVYNLMVSSLVTLIREVFGKDTAPEDPSMKAKEEAEAFTELFSQRIQENEHLEDWIENSGMGKDADGSIGIAIHRMAGTTYMVLHTQPEFLKKIRQPDGSYDEESMRRLRSLHPWMVFDLVTAHPEYKFLLPREILNTTKLH